MRLRSVFGCNPRTSAALPRPLIRHRHRRNASSTYWRSISSSVPASRSDADRGSSGTSSRCKRAASGVDHRPLDHIRQLTDVPRPRPLAEGGKDDVGNARELPVQRALPAIDEVPDQAREILEPFAQRRERDGKDVEPIVQIRSKAAFLHRGLEIVMGRGDDADVNLA